MTIRDGMSAKLKRITSAFQKMERAARSADKATQAVNPGRTLENSASLIDRARKRLDAFKLEEKVDKHNSVIERTFKLEEQAALIEERIKVANHRIEDLEKAQ